MGVTVQNVRIQLKRDNDYNYASHPDFLPLKGEVCLVDTASDGLKVKVGDGTHLFTELDWYYPQDHYGDTSLKLGYYYNGQFYEDYAHTQLIQPNSDNLYIDLAANAVYYYFQDHYIAIAQGGPSVKLYESMGQNTDGAMTQKATTDELNQRVKVLNVNSSLEQLVISY